MKAITVFPGKAESVYRTALPKQLLTHGMKGLDNSRPLLETRTTPKGAIEGVLGSGKSGIVGIGRQKQDGCLTSLHCSRTVLIALALSFAT